VREWVGVEGESGRTRRLSDVYDLECEVKQKRREWYLWQYLLRESKVGNEERERERERRGLQEGGRRGIQQAIKHEQLFGHFEMTRHPVSASALAGKLPSLGLCTDQPLRIYIVQFVQTGDGSMLS
jgi:hypothetical protein